MTNVIIENDNVLGKGILLHVGTFVSHDVLIGDFCEISPCVKLLGGCSVGNFCSIGTGAVILPRIKIGDRAIVGAGAVVNSDVEPGTTVVGVPAKKIR
jgi:acetyltransferase-like isoleucine patch superfamily enzyme